MRNRASGLKIKNPIIATLLSLKGNQRACVWTEPLWGIPYNLYFPLAAVYMVALGLTPVQIGIVETAYFISQTFWAMLAGVLTDKMGRRMATFLIDLVAWSVPTLLWMGAQGFWWFFIAGVFNGMWRVTENSWGLLLTEDAPEDKLVHLYTLVSVAGLIAGFVSPLTVLFRQRYSLVTLMRFLYGLTFVMMTAKFVILYFMSHETEVGKRRKEDSRGISVFSRLWDSRHVLKTMLQSRRIMLTVLIVTCFAVITSINDKFWPLLLTDKLLIPDTTLPMLNTLRTLGMLVLYFTLGPRLDIRRFKKPVMLGMGLYAGISLMLFFLPGGSGSLWLVSFGVAVEALSLSMLNPLIPALNMQMMEKEERARMLSLATMFSLLIASAFAPVSGMLSELNRGLPMLLLCAAALTAVYLTHRLDKANPFAPEAAD